MSAARSSPTVRASRPLPSCGGGPSTAGVELLAPAVAIGLFEQGLVPVAYGSLLLKFRASRIVVASGIAEQPLVFPGNDLVGVMLPDAARRLVNGFSIKPAERAVVLTVDDRGLKAAADLEAAGVRIAAVVDFRRTPPPQSRPRARAARSRRSRSTGAT